jgi:hypothetical protein
VKFADRRILLTVGQEYAQGSTGWWVAMPMTQQYLVGEMSMLLARLQTLAGDEIAGGVGLLRREAEESGPYALATVELRALDLTDRLCWSSLIRGDVYAFERQAAVGAQLREFGVGSGLLPG